VKSEERVKEVIRTLTKRSRGDSFSRVIDELNEKLRGWINYFKLIEAYSKLEDLDSWMRRKLRCYRLKQRRKCKSLSSFLMGLWVPEENARKTASSEKGWWRIANTPTLKQAMLLKV
jgi:predicted CopG family antitoxin